MPQKPMRIYGYYAAVCITQGQGSYCDVNGFDRIVRTGDIIFILPEVGHSYTPDPGTTWNEIYTVFDGPVFDFWRNIGYLDAVRPVRRAPSLERWVEGITGLAKAESWADSISQAHQTIKFLDLLTEVLAVEEAAATNADPQRWAARACSVLADNIDEALSVELLAERMHMTADTFRRRFKKEVGLSPIEYRLRKKIEVACLLLRSTQMTHAGIARRLGFLDEYHFSKRFRQQMNESPRDYRRPL